MAVTTPIKKKRKGDKRHIRGELQTERFILSTGQRRLMESIGPTDLSRKSGISRTSLYKIMHAETPEMNIVTIRKLAHAFNMQDWEFLKLK